jgi:hypothetical protein
LREPPAVADAPHAIVDRQRRHAGREEVDVQRVTGPIARGARGGHQRLREELAAEDPRAQMLDASAFVPVVVDRFQRERIEQGLERGGHLRARLPHPRRRVKT